MEQRPLRLGDVVDDYCPRERRVTNHAIVAIVGESIRQTRCATCDTEHEYKGPKMKLTKKKGKGEADLAGGVLVTPQANDADATGGAEPVVAVVAETIEVEVSIAQTNGDPNAPKTDDVPDGWLAHRPLIRASLPKTEGSEPPPRPIPEFTMHQRPGRSFHRGFRHGGGGNPGSQGGHGNGFNDGNGPDGNRASQPGKPGGGGAGRRRRRRRR